MWLFESTLLHFPLTIEKKRTVNTTSTCAWVLTHTVQSFDQEKKTAVNKIIRKLKSLSICEILSQESVAQADLKCKESKSAVFVTEENNT